MSVSYTPTQKRRLKELGASTFEIDQLFESSAERNDCFRNASRNYVSKERNRLKEFRENSRRPQLCQLEWELSEILIHQGFIQVTTPVMMSAGLLIKMGIDATHALNSQIFWLNEGQCLRPMLAPHLYYVIKDLLRLYEKPIGIFEVGPCFRKESEGASHSNEFTMLNVTEFGLPEEKRHERIKELTQILLQTAGIEHFLFENESSAVYGDTIDIIQEETALELGSSAMGPHPLDSNWQVTDTWVGIGFGLERLLMARDGGSNLSKWCRSLSYLDGIRLNI